MSAATIVVAACWTPPDTSDAGLNCAPGESPCNGRCVDYTSDPNNCGFCAEPCGATSLGQQQYCNQGYCTPAYGNGSQCIPENVGCSFSGECCSLFCGDAGTCTLIPSGTAGCASDSNCQSGHCDSNRGVCR